MNRLAGPAGDGDAGDFAGEKAGIGGTSGTVGHLGGHGASESVPESSVYRQGSGAAIAQVLASEEAGEEFGAVLDDAALKGAGEAAFVGTGGEVPAGGLT